MVTWQWMCELAYGERDMRVVNRKIVDRRYVDLDIGKLVSRQSTMSWEPLDLNRKGKIVERRENCHPIIGSVVDGGGESNYKRLAVGADAGLATL